MGFILAGYNVIGGFDVCPAAVRFLRRKFGHLIPAENFIVGDVNDPADRAKLPVGAAAIVSVALQCQPSSTSNQLPVANDKRLDTGDRMVQAAIAMRPLTILCENVVGFYTRRRERFQHVCDLLTGAAYIVEHCSINSRVWHLVERLRPPDETWSGEWAADWVASRLLAVAPVPSRRRRL